jgi:hypothetical protein
MEGGWTPGLQRISNEEHEDQFIIYVAELCQLDSIETSYIPRPTSNSNFQYISFFSTYAASNPLSFPA